MCHSQNCRCRNFNSMRQQRSEHLALQVYRYRPTNPMIAEAYERALMRLLGYRPR